MGNVKGVLGLFLAGVVFYGILSIGLKGFDSIRKTEEEKLEEDIGYMEELLREDFRKVKEVEYEIVDKKESTRTVSILTQSEVKTLKLTVRDSDGDVKDIIVIGEKSAKESSERYIGDRIVLKEEEEGQIFITEDYVMYILYGDEEFSKRVLELDKARKKKDKENRK